MLIVVIKATAIVVVITITLTADCLIKCHALAHRYFCYPFDLLILLTN